MKNIFKFFFGTKEDTKFTIVFLLTIIAIAIALYLAFSYGSKTATTTQLWTEFVQIVKEAF